MFRVYCVYTRLNEKTFKRASRYFYYTARPEPERSVEMKKKKKP